MLVGITIGSMARQLAAHFLRVQRMASSRPPSDPAAGHIRRYARQRAWCEWDEHELWASWIAEAMANPDGADWPPFHLLSLDGIGPDQQRRCASRWMRQRLAASAEARADVHPRRPPPRERGPQERLRIGYLSSDFQQHATALLMIEMLEAHDRDRFELHAYNHGPRSQGEMRQRLRQAFSAFHEIGDLDDQTTARAIQEDGIDILVDLKGYTEGSRSPLLSWRPAPVLVSYLGYPGTLGDGHADYLISDRRVTPRSSAAHYAEALACLPHSYQPHARHQAIGLQRQRDRKAHGLPDDGVVLCCFNQPWKFSPAVFDVWCRVLARVPDSVLWLLDDERARGNLRNEAFQRGIDPSRLVFAPDVDQSAHLARLPQADLMLDTWPYNAHTTASDALGAGVPLVTLSGHTFAGRVAESLLHAVGLPELVAQDLSAYEALAVALASQPDRLEAVKTRLVRHLPTAPLFDVSTYTADLEALFEHMWQRHTEGLAPAAIDLTSVRPLPAGSA